MLELEFTDNTLVMTSHGVERLADILKRPVSLCLWAVKWSLSGGISFHTSHTATRRFVEAHAVCKQKPIGPARLINVSQAIYDRVARDGYLWTDLKDFDEAINYEEITCSH